MGEGTAGAPLLRAIQGSVWPSCLVAYRSSPRTRSPRLRRFAPKPSSSSSMRSSLDKSGQPVTDLTAKDFEVRDEDSPRSVELFSAGRAARRPRRYATRARSPGAIPYSTNVGTDARVARAFVIFFDDVHLTREDGERAKTAIAQFLERRGPRRRPGVARRARASRCAGMRGCPKGARRCRRAWRRSRARTCRTLRTSG